MLRRFVAEELVREFPYDPEGGFGRRLFLFGEEVVPILIEYAAHADSFLRRNATTALGRYRTRTSLRALNAVAVSTKDPVALMRSLAALGEHRTLVDARALLGRLAKASDAIEEVAIIVALGRCQRREGADADGLRTGQEVEDCYVDAAPVHSHRGASHLLDIETWLSMDYTRSHDSGPRLPGVDQSLLCTSA